VCFSSFGMKLDTGEPVVGVPKPGLPPVYSQQKRFREFAVSGAHDCGNGGLMTFLELFFWSCSAIRSSLPSLPHSLPCPQNVSLGQLFLRRNTHPWDWKSSKKEKTTEDVENDRVISACTCVFVCKHVLFASMRAYLISACECVCV
jgi:hypothetical protein